MDLILHRWPEAGVLLATALLGWSLTEARPAGAGPRWSDPTFLLPLLWPMYLLHQYEEHGVDALGRPYAFQGAICQTLGFAAVQGCPADEAFIFAVNVIACPAAFVLPYVFRRTRPLLAAMGWGVPLVNAVAHVGAWVKDGAYNPGLLTSLLLFLPLGLWTMRALLRRGELRAGELWLVAALGVVVHAVLLGSLQLRLNGVLDAAGLFLVNALNGPAAVALGRWLAGRALARRVLEPHGAPR